MQLEMNQGGLRGLAAKVEELEGMLRESHAEEAVVNYGLVELISVFDHLKTSADGLGVTIAENLSESEAVEEEKENLYT